MFRILDARTLTPVTKLFVVEAPLVARKTQPGQFIILRLHERGERIPLTIADFDPQAGTVTIVFQEVGKSTRELGVLRAGDAIRDFVGPLGVPADLPGHGTVVCVGGGVGVAPVLPKAKAMHEAGVKVISIIGARSRDLLILEEEMRAVSAALHICTDDGSYGRKGFVSEVLKDVLAGGQVDEVVAVGPLPMMRACVEVTRPLGVKTWVSMNTIMVDGTGMCGACRLTVGGKTKFCCVDGPMFDGHEVDFAEAMRRNLIYAEEEKRAGECACGGGR
ncbi:MAG: sulfide/dihydroorotate dehydrogenase-like FAD/NAD-binding protein [Bacillota bacterium]